MARLRSHSFSDSKAGRFLSRGLQPSICPRVKFMGFTDPVFLYGLPAHSCFIGSQSPYSTIAVPLVTCRRGHSFCLLGPRYFSVLAGTSRVFLCFFSFFLSFTLIPLCPLSILIDVRAPFCNRCGWFTILISLDAYNFFSLRSRARHIRRVSSFKRGICLGS